MLQPYVTSLVHEGFVIVPPHIHKLSVEVIERASTASQKLIKHMSGLSCQTALLRPGEEEPEIGLIERTLKEGKDIKHFLHITHDFRSLVRGVPELEKELSGYWNQVKVLETLYHKLSFFISTVLHHVSAQVDSLSTLNPSLPSRFIESCHWSLPDSTTTLRALWYPATESQKGARGHFDRSFITAHLGDCGGSLFAHREMGPGQAFEVSPAPGHILLFWGVKALMLSNGALKPLWHSASTFPGRERSALVLFGHLKTAQQIDDAKLAFFRFCEQNNIINPKAFYEELMRE